MGNAIQPGDGGREGRPHAGAGRVWVLPALAALAVHFPALFGAFVYDDVPLIVQHPRLGTPSFAAELWQRDYGLEFASSPKGFYRPGFMSLVWLVHRVAGPSPLAFHAVGLGLFALAAALVARVAARCLAWPPFFAVTAGVLYAVHPARVEVVSLVMSWPDLLVEIAALGTVLVLLRPPAAPGAADGWPRAAACAALGLLGALCKESAFFVLSGLAVTAGLYAVLWGGAPRRPLRLAAGGTGLGLGLGLLCRFQAGVRSPLALPDAIGAALGDRAGTALVVVGRALREFVVPGPCVFWFRAAAHGDGVASLGVVLFAAAALAVWAVALRRRHLPSALLLAWIGANLVSLVLLAAGGYAYSQRYLAVAPLALALGAAARAGMGLWRRRRAVPPLRPRLAGLLVAAALTPFAAWTLAGSITCRTPLSFFTALHEASPHDVVPLGALAQTLNELGAAEEVVEAHVRQATGLDPAHPQVPRLHNMVIKRYLDERRYAEALRFADWSRAAFPRDDAKMALRAVALAGLGRYEEAIREVGSARAARPGNAAYEHLMAEFVRDAGASTGAEVRAVGPGGL